MEFVLLYTKEEFLTKFHKRLIQSIQDNNYVIENDKFILYKKGKLKIPSVPELGDLDYQKILTSAYMIT